jgi:predicted nucleic acid-binding protein
VLRYYATRILPIDLGIARRWGRLADAHGHAGADLLIAATAMSTALPLSPVTCATSKVQAYRWSIRFRM